MSCSSLRFGLQDGLHAQSREQRRAVLICGLTPSLLFHLSDTKKTTAAAHGMERECLEKPRQPQHAAKILDDLERVVVLATWRLICRFAPCADSTAMQSGHVTQHPSRESTLGNRWQPAVTGCKEIQRSYITDITLRWVYGKPRTNLAQRNTTTKERRTLSELRP